METRRRVTVRSIAIFAALLLCSGIGAFVLRAEPIPQGPQTAPIVFVCRNGVAMSLWSAAYFNRLAAARGLRQHAIARAALPSFNAVPLNMTVALALDGFRLDGFRPQVISADDARAAEHVVAIDTELPPDVRSTPTERWQGFPPMREEYFPSRKALKARVEALVESLASRDGSARLVTP